MKARPVKLVYGQGYFDCSVEEATHVELNMPGPIPARYLPVILRGTRAGTNCWSWNGSVDAPTLHPSVLSTTQRLEGTKAVEVRCHTWITDGRAQFLPDTTHELSGQTVDLLDIEREEDVSEI